MKTRAIKLYPMILIFVLFSTIVLASFTKGFIDTNNVINTDSTDAVIHNAGNSQGLKLKHLANPGTQTSKSLSNYINNNFTYIKHPSLSSMSKVENNVALIVSYRDRNIDIQGSGFFIDRNYLVTNYHVIKGAHQVEVYTEFGVYDKATLVKYDEHLDIAILKVNTDSSEGEYHFPKLKLGSLEYLEKGEPVFTIGSPQGLFNTISEGIISGIRGYEDDRLNKTINLIQITAPITHGSSGGPLINTKGEVIGISTFGYNDGQLNFAIPIDYIKSWLYDLGRYEEIDIYNHSISNYNHYLKGEENFHLNPKNSIELNQWIEGVNSLHHPTEPIIYYTIEDNKGIQLVAYNYEMDERMIHLFESFILDLLYIDDTRLYLSHHHDGMTDYVVMDVNTFEVINSINIRDIDNYLSDIENDTFNLLGRIAEKSSYYDHIIPFAIHPNYDRAYYYQSKFNMVNKKGEEHRLFNSNISYHGMKIFNFTPDGKYMIFNHGLVLNSTYFKQTNGEYITKIDEFTDLAFDSTRDLLFTAKGDSVKIYNYKSLNQLDQIKLEGNIIKIFYHNNNLIVVIYNSDNNNHRYELQIYELQDGGNSA